ncbi:uncharacterized protein CLUP02_06404 [Colletotrichum lupini]|uniref:Uncharacterized protein n=1 Tax=Colletotrichum lupini TaxID=145971 RepID=A0A9Q8WEM0_9PEZI|nr:uncharacterized protein CLUP02_06404 [Colletotrichum lupini]UQC80918.1 hypothetical protein CLUP02_06404 [Colletotrichum lupini]
MRDVPNVSVIHFGSGGQGSCHSPHVLMPLTDSWPCELDFVLRYQLYKLEKTQSRHKTPAFL